MRGDAITFGDLAGTITMLEIACRQCERRGQLSVARLIKQYGDMRLPELRYILVADCPRVVADKVYDRCGVHYPQLNRLGL